MNAPPRRSPLSPSTTLSRSRRPASTGDPQDQAAVAPAEPERVGQSPGNFRMLVVEKVVALQRRVDACRIRAARLKAVLDRERSEEHTSELQSQSNLVCRLLL